MAPENMASPALPRFGANYTPSVDWAHAWYDINEDDVRADFEGLAKLGLDHVRLLPLWPILQPNRSLIRPKAVEDVVKVVDIAREFDMDSTVDVFQGHLSSFDYVPAWMGTWHWRNMFTNPDVIEGEVALVEALGTALNEKPGFLGLTVGNEINQFSGQPHPDPMPASHEEVSKWLETMLDAARRTVPEGFNLHACYDAAFYMQDHPFTPAHTARFGDATSIHSWIFNGTGQRYGGTSLEAERHAEYLIELSRAFAEDRNHPVWLQEVGAPSNQLSPDEMPDFLEKTIRHSLNTKNLWGVTWWCSHDVSRSLVDFPELEYSLGLLDSDRKVKPIGERFAEVIADVRANPPTPADRTSAVVVDVDEDATPLVRPALAPGGTVFEAWMDLARSGEDPAVVLSTDNPEDFGITEVVEVENRGPKGGYKPTNTEVEEDG